MENYIMGFLNSIPKELAILIGSMVPILELRFALPFALANGMDVVPSYLLAVLGNCIPIPFIVMFIRPIFDYLKHKTRLKKFVLKMEAKAEAHANKIQTYEKWGLFLFVAVPLPGTGAWTGSLVAAFLGMRIKDCIVPIAGGVMTAGLIMTCGTMLVKMFF